MAETERSWNGLAATCCALRCLRSVWGAPGRQAVADAENVWKGDTHALGLEPHDLMVRLCAAIPPPWFHMTRYFGVLSSHSKHRSRVVPSDGDPERYAPPPVKGDQLEFGLASTASADCGLAVEPVAPRRQRSRWGWLLSHVFRADVETCDHCGGPMRWVQATRDPADIQRVLRKHGLALEPKA